MASHPAKAIDMVVAAIVQLKERDGASEEAITKYIGSNNDVDMKKVGPHIRRALKNGAKSGKLISTQKGLYKVSPTVASAALMKQEKAKASKKVAAKNTTGSTVSKLVKPKHPTPKKAAVGKTKKKGPVSSKPKKKSKGGKKSGKKQTSGKKTSGKKGGKKK